MYRRKQLTLGGWLLIALFLLGFYAIELLSNTPLLWHGVAAQGVITGEEGIGCGKSGMKQIFSVRFTDQAGQAHTGTISQCDYGFYGPIGSSVTIVYLPNDPTTIAPTDGLITNALVNLIFTILFGLITLILLPFWIRKRIWKRSLHPEVDAGSYSTATRWREPMNEEPPQGVGGEDAVESGTAEIAPTMSQLLSGLRRVSERIDSMIADAARSREALHWAKIRQGVEDIMNHPRDIEYVVQLARAARDLRGILLLHQNVLDRAAESNHLLHSLISEASCSGQEPVRDNGYASD